MATVLGICAKRHRKWRKTSCGNACNVTRTGGKYHWLCPRRHKCLENKLRQFQIHSRQSGQAPHRPAASGPASLRLLMDGKLILSRDQQSAGRNGPTAHRHPKGQLLVDSWLIAKLCFVLLVRFFASCRHAGHHPGPVPLHLESVIAAILPVPPPQVFRLRGQIKNKCCSPVTLTWVDMTWPQLARTDRSCFSKLNETERDGSKSSQDLDKQLLSQCP